MLLHFEQTDRWHLAHKLMGTHNLLKGKMILVIIITEKKPGWWRGLSHVTPRVRASAEPGKPRSTRFGPQFFRGRCKCEGKLHDRVGRESSAFVRACISLCCYLHIRKKKRFYGAALTAYRHFYIQLLFRIHMQPWHWRQATVLSQDLCILLPISSKLWQLLVQCRRTVYVEIN